MNPVVPQPKRVIVARLFHESHGFNPTTTPEDGFVVLRGEAALQEGRDSGATLRGIIRVLEEAGIELIPVFSAGAPPSGLVEHGFYLDLRQILVEAIRTHKPDAIALELHGAMGTTLLPDAEGDLLQALRAAAGPDVAIGVGLDLHAHLTPAMLGAADICIACKENPHSDVIACGEKVARGLLAMLDGTFSPVRTLVKVPMLLPGANDTATGPLRHLHDMARAFTEQTPALWDVSLYNVFRFLDDEGMGQAVVITSHGHDESAKAAASHIGQEFWRLRADFVDDLKEIGEALDLVAERAGSERYVLADMGDRVLAAAPGDSTAILAQLLLRPERLRAAIPVTDPVTVAKAFELGVGQTAKFELGGRMTPSFTPLTITARVESLSDGMFRMAGPYRGGELTALGDATVLRVDERISVLVTSKPGFTHDPAAFESNGIRIADQDCVVVKSGYHFMLNFAGLATPLLLRTPGIGYPSKGLFRWTKGRFWPEHDVGPTPVEKVLTFGRSGKALLPR